MYKRISILFLLFFSGIIFAARRTYTTCRLEGEKPKIDGLILEEAWEKVPWSGDFVQIAPYENRKPSQETMFKLIFDDDNLYVAIRCFDAAPDSIDKRLTKRDAFDGDYVIISFDSYHDLLTASTFCVNAAGVKGDGIISGDGNTHDTNHDPVWDVKTSCDTEGWTAEMEIPLTQLRFAEKEQYIWGLQLLRYIYRKGEESYWQFKSPKAPGFVSYYGELHGIQNIKPRKQKDIIPYTVGKIETYQKDTEDPFSKGKEYHTSPGLDAKMGITNDLTLDIAINPDFGQVEADPSEMNLTTYETYWNEKRPFFIEGKNILNFSILPYGGDMSSDNLFYSRRIGKNLSYYPEAADDGYINMPQYSTILCALKLTGKTHKGWSVGVLESVTQQEIAEIDTHGFRWKEEVEPLTNYFVGRLQKDLNNSNTKIGGIITATHRKITSPAIEDLFHRQAYTGGFDFNHQWKNKTYYILVNTEFSHIRGSKEAIFETQINAPHFFQREDAAHLEADSNKNSLTGYSGTLNFGRQGNGKWSYTTWITWRSPGFNLGELGYLRQDDKIQQLIWVGYRENEPVWIFRSINLNMNQWSAFSFGGEEIYRGINLENYFQFNNFWQLGFGSNRNGKSLSMWELRGGPALRNNPSTEYYGNISSNDRKKIKASFSYYGFTQDKSTAGSNNFNFGITCRPFNELDFSVNVNYIKRFNELQYINSIDDYTQQRYIMGRMDQKETNLIFRFNLILSPDFTIQYYGMPFISAGKFTKLKYITHSKAEEFSDRFQLFLSNQIFYDQGNNIYQIDENTDNVSDYEFDNPDFNVYDFNSNLVVRWEYKPGSLLFLVWAQNRNTSQSNGDFYIGNNVNELFSVFPGNVFLIKLSYRIGL